METDVDIGKSGRFEKFTSLILGLNRAVQRIKSEEMAQLGLKGVHVNCLYYLGTSGELSQSELTALCGEDKAYMSRALAVLEKHGIAVKQNAAVGKKYNSKIELTEYGKELSQRVFGMVGRAVAAGSRDLTDDDRKALYRSLAIVLENLEDYKIKEEQK